jgi:type II secretory pathway pseudopilin PulG
MNTMLATLSHYRWQQAQLTMPDIHDAGGYFGNDLQAAAWLFPSIWGAPTAAPHSETPTSAAWPDGINRLPHVRTTTNLIGRKSGVRTHTEYRVAIGDLRLNITCNTRGY